MIKNKDGSYNKFSLLIISLIGIIGIGIIGSTLITEPQTIDPMPLAYIGLIISGGLTIYYGKKVFLKPKSNIQLSLKKEEEVFTVEEIKPIKETYRESSGFGLRGIASMVLALVIGGFGLMIGSVVINSMIQALPEIQSNDPMSSSVTQVTGTVSSAFNIASLMLIVFAVMGLISVLFKITTDTHDY